MTVSEWLRWAHADAERRGLSGLKPLLESLGRAIQTLRDADFNHRADGDTPKHRND